MNYLDSKNALKEGIYHEIGHVVATWLCFSDGERLRGISLKKRPNGSYRLSVEWKDSITFNYNTQLDAFTYSTLAGGVFQQMKNAQNSLNRKLSKYTIIEAFVNRFNKDRALLMYIKRNVKPFCKGMEEDLETLKNVYDNLYEEKHITQGLDIKKATDNCISLLFPLINCPEIDSLCDYCLNAFWEGGQNQAPQIEVNIETIKGFIGKLF